jgi:hypothetical protein
MQERVHMLRLTDEVWFPYVAGVTIGLLEIPAFLMGTALGASSYVTIGAHIAGLFDSGATTTS